MTRTRVVTAAALRRMPLPEPDASSDKDARGRVLVIGGSASVPGALLLAGVAALRAGAGKLQLATVRRVAPALGVAVPEALVLSLPENRAGELAGTRATNLLRGYADRAECVLVGPGMSSERSARALLRPLPRMLRGVAVLVLDAAAILALSDDTVPLAPLEGRVVLTPHAGEMASLLGVEKEQVQDDPRAAALEASQRFRAVVALKGPESWIATPAGALHHYVQGGVGLATSGSGDTLAGIVAGLAARGASAEQAAVWAVYLHGAAGHALARRLGPYGYLARELLDEVTVQMHRLG